MGQGPRHETLLKQLMAQCRGALAAAAVCLALAGCAVGPDYSEPDPGAMPGALPSAIPAGEGAAASGADAGASWYDGFNDPGLTALLSLAETNSIDVLVALRRIEASRAALSAARAEFWPNVGFSAGTSKGKSWNPDGDSEKSSARFDASWEIDLFGRLRRSAEAARAELQAAEFTFEDAMVSLFAEIAAEYVNLLHQDELLAISEENIGIASNFHEIAKAKFDAGTVPELDWLSAQSQLSSAKAALASQEAARTACLRRIELLCSLPPGGAGQITGRAGAGAPKIPEAPPLQPAIPSDLLRNRPDVRRAERAYAAALARVGVAKANYFPTVSIGAGFSLSSSEFADWGDAVRSLDFGPSLNWSIFSFGRTRAKVAQARAAAEVAALEYRAAALGAFHEVENAAIELDRDIVREGHMREALEAQRRACDLSLQMYREDLGEYKDVLSAQQALNSARREVSDLGANIILKKIALQKALGRR